MGRVKLQIKKLETAVGKQVTYSKRRTGLQKKAQELSILCDIDIVLILFSPAGKLSWTVGHKSTVEQVITRFANLSPQERAKRKLEGLEQLKRVFNKLGDDINVEEYMQLSAVPVNAEELFQQLQALRRHLVLLEQRLSSYENFNTVEEGEELERTLREQLLKIRSQKQILEASQQVVPFSHGISAQFYQHEGLPRSAVLEGNIQGNWIAEHGQHSVLALHHESSSSFPQRDANSGAVCSSFPAGIMHFGRQSECTEDQVKYNLYSQWRDTLRVKSYEHQIADTQKQQRSDVDVDHCPTSEFVSRNRSALTNNILSGSRESLSWGPSPQSMDCDEAMNSQPTTYQLEQHAHTGITAEGVQSCSMHHQLELFRPQSSPAIIQNHHDAHECSW